MARKILYGFQNGFNLLKLDLPATMEKLIMMKSSTFELLCPFFPL